MTSKMIVKMIVHARIKPRVGFERAVRKLKKILSDEHPDVSFFVKNGYPISIYFGGGKISYEDLLRLLADNQESPIHELEQIA